MDQKVLIKLVDRLNRYPMGLPDSPEIREFLSEFLEPDEALLASVFPMREASAKELAKRAGFSLEKTAQLLEGMAEKGTVLDFKIASGSVFWMLTPSIIGFIEFSLMKMHRGKDMNRLAQMLKEYEDNHLWGEVFGSKTQFTRALVEMDVPISSKIVTYALAEETIRASGGGALQTCFCRHQAHLLGEPCKLVGFEGTCIGLGNAANFMVRRGFGRKASVEELLEVLKETGKKGLIHITDNIRERPTFICNCCGCCCGLLAGIKRKNLVHAISPTPYILKIAADKCTACGACAKKCQITAIHMHEDAAHLDAVNCLGCGSCVKFCKVGALTLVERDRVPKIPRDLTMRYVKMAFEKGRLHHQLPMLKSRIRGHF
jgi:ferredoxin